MRFFTLETKTPLLYIEVEWHTWLYFI